MIEPMVALGVRTFSRSEWSGLIAGFADRSLMQCWEYAEAKALTGPWRVERGLFTEGGLTAGAYQALVRRLPCGLPGGLVWINRGPLWRDAGAERADVGPLVALMAALRNHYADRRGLYLRLAPPVADGSLSDDDVRRAGLARAGTPGWASAVLDLTVPEATLRAGLRQKWRNGLNKAERAGLLVRSGSGQGPFAAFLSGHGTLNARPGLATGVTAEFLCALQALLPEDRRMEAFVAESDGTVVGSVLMARYGGYCEYLAGNLTDEGRRLGAGQLLLWRAACAMKGAGMRRFDLGGLDPEETPAGIVRFKDGLGGTRYRLAPELEAGGGGVLGRLVRWRVRGARTQG